MNKTAEIQNPSHKSEAEKESLFPPGKSEPALVSTPNVPLFFSLPCLHYPAVRLVIVPTPSSTDTPFNTLSSLPFQQPGQKCKCSFCSPAVNHSSHEPISGLKSKSNIYDRIPPLISIASTVNQNSIKNGNIPWSSDAELPKLNSKRKDNATATAPKKDVETVRASSLTKPRGKQVTCTCSFCAKSFTTTRALELHVRRHSGLRPYPCKFCDKCFYQPSERAVHMRTHTGARPYRCPYCLKLFRYSGDLKQHINIHTGQRPYQCEICAKAFTNHSTLRQHRRIHTGERPYKCEECGKTYRYHSSLKQHLAVHAANKMTPKQMS